MNIHEHQSKAILRSYGICVPDGHVVSSLEEAKQEAEKFISGTIAVKAQIHAGGRGKAGGVKIAHNADEIILYVGEMLNKTLITHQTGPKGKQVKSILLEKGCEIANEYYAAFVIDRETARVVFIASSEGGTDIETIAGENPESIIREIIDPLVGFSDFQARRAAYGISIPQQHIGEFTGILKKLYACFIERDCALAEINPLVLTRDGKFIALDAKLNFDDNGLFRQSEVLSLRDTNEEDPKELQASEHGLSYVALDGNIGCMVNGAGLAMATMDIIKHYGGSPANFLDVGGSATAAKVTAAFNIILSDQHVKAIFVNIFGGIMKCDVIAEGLVSALRCKVINLPIVVRLEGTNAAEGKKVLELSGIRFFTADSMVTGAQKIVELTKEAAF